MTRIEYNLYRFIDDNWETWNRVSGELDVSIPKLAHQVARLREMDARYEFSEFSLLDEEVFCTMLNPDTQTVQYLRFPLSYIFGEDVEKREAGFKILRKHII